MKTGMKISLLDKGEVSKIIDRFRQEFEARNLGDFLGVWGKRLTGCLPKSSFRVF
jgi:hypothetical protein